MSLFFFFFFFFPLFTEDFRSKHNSITFFDAPYFMKQNISVILSFSFNSLSKH